MRICSVASGLTLVLLLAAACSRDLALPPALVPPRLDPVHPALPRSGYAGDSILLEGTGLGARATTVVTFAGVQAAVLSDQPDGGPPGSLLVQVPLLAEDGVHGFDAALRVETAEGSASIPDFRYLGAGHPQRFTVRNSEPLSPDLVALAGSGSTLFALDDFYGVAFPIALANGAIGGALDSPQDGAHSLATISAATDAAGLLREAAGFVEADGTSSVVLFHLDPASGSATGEVAADRFEAPLGFSQPVSSAASSWSPGARFLAVEFGYAVPQHAALVDAAARTATPLDLSALPSPVWWTQMISETTLVGAAGSFDQARVFTLDVQSGVAAVGADAVDLSSTLLAARPDGGLLVFLEQDFSTLGAVDLHGATPTLTSTHAPTFLASASGLAWSADGSAVFVSASAPANQVTCLDGSLAPRGSASIAAPFALAPIHDAAFPGLLGVISGAADLDLITAQCTLLRSQRLVSGAQSVGVEPTAGAAVVGTPLGSAAFFEEQPGKSAQLVDRLPLAASAGGALAASAGALLQLRCPADGSLVCARAPRGALSGDPLALALSADGATALVVSSAASITQLEVFRHLDSRAPAAPADAILPVGVRGDVPAGLGFLEDGAAFYVFGTDGGTGSVAFVQPGAATVRTVALADAPTIAFALRGGRLLVSKAIGGALLIDDADLSSAEVAVSNSDAFLAAAPDGTVYASGGASLTQGRIVAGSSGAFEYRIQGQLALPSGPSAVVASLTGRHLFVLLPDVDQLLVIE